MYIWTHKKFDIGYNGKHIVDVNLTSESKVKLQPNAQLKFTYEVLTIIVEELLCNVHVKYHGCSLITLQFNSCTFDIILI